MAGVPLGLAGLALLVKGIADYGNARRDAQTAKELELMGLTGNGGESATGQTPESVQALGQPGPGTANIGNGPMGQAKQPTSIDALASTVTGKEGQPSPPGSPSPAYQEGPAPADSGQGDDRAEGMYGYKLGDQVGPPPEPPIRTDDGHEAVESQAPMQPGTEGARSILETPTTARYSPRDPTVPRTIWNDPSLLPKGTSISRKLPNGTTVSVTGEGSIEDLYLRAYVTQLAQMQVQRAFPLPSSNTAKLQADIALAQKEGRTEDAARLQKDLDAIKAQSTPGKLWADYQQAQEAGDYEQANFLWGQIQSEMKKSRQLSPEESLTQALEVLRNARDTGVLSLGGAAEGATLSVSVDETGNPKLNMVMPPEAPQAQIDQAGTGLVYMGLQSGKPLAELLMDVVPQELADEGGKKRFLSPEATAQVVNLAFNPEFLRAKQVWKLMKPEASDEELQILAARSTYEHHGIFPETKGNIFEKLIFEPEFHIPPEVMQFVIDISGSPMGMFQPGVMDQARERAAQYEATRAGWVKKATTKETPISGEEAASGGIPLGTTYGEVRSGKPDEDSLPFGQRLMSIPVAQRKDVRTLSDVRDTLYRLRSVADQAFNEQSFLVRTIKNPMQAAGRVAQVWDMAGLKYQRDSAAIPTLIGRIVGSEVGNFSNTDVTRYIEKLPKIGLFKDRRDFAMGQIDELIADVDARINNYYSSLAPVKQQDVDQAAQTRSKMEERQRILDIKRQRQERR